MKSALNGPSSQHYITKTLNVILRELPCRGLEKQYNWKGPKFPVSIKKIDKFEKNNPGIAVNALLSKKNNQNIYTARRSVT